MDKFSKIHKRAIKRKGSEAALLEHLSTPKNSRQLAKLGDDRILSEMTRCVFQAGFVWRVVNAKWDDFERVFSSFDPYTLSMTSPEQIEAIAKDPAIVRNLQKVTSVQRNAQFIVEQGREHGSFAKLIAGWPAENQIELLKLLKKQGSRLGGMTGPRVLRNLGFDAFMLTKDVVACLQQAGVQISNSPSSQKDLTLVQTAFNTWHRETGLPYSHLSRICACSTGDNISIERLSA
jgi:3-methyladenine DNA glycosylase Tag